MKLRSRNISFDTPIRLLVVTALLSVATVSVSAEPHRDVEAGLRQDVAEASTQLATAPDDIQSLLRRGDALFFLGDFDKAISDFDRMISLRPTLAPTHWQRGLALYFAGRYDEAAKQFERFYELDKSDRENGIWRFYSQVRLKGVEVARKELLPYEQPDRDPLPLVYQLCAGDVNQGDVLNSITEADITDREKQKRQFYASLYVGLDYWIVNRNADSARPLLKQALASPWPRTAGYGPSYMWHVARLALSEIDQAMEK